MNYSVCAQIDLKSLRVYDYNYNPVIGSIIFVSVPESYKKFITFTDSSGHFYIHDSILNNHDSITVEIPLPNGYIHKTKIATNFSDTLIFIPRIITISEIEIKVEPKHSDEIFIPINEYLTNNNLATGLPSIIQKNEPFAFISRKSGWDVNISIEGLDAKRIRSRLEGSSLYSLCPMEMGGCLSGIGSLLLESITIDNKNYISGGIGIELSGGTPRFYSRPIMEADIISALATSGLNREIGAKTVVASKKWFIKGGALFSKSNSYTAGDGNIVKNSDYSGLSSMFKLARKFNRSILELTHFLSKTLEAGYPTVEKVRIIDETRNILSLKFKTSKNNLTATLSSSFQYGAHLMKMPQGVLYNLYSGAQNYITDLSTKLTKRFRTSSISISLNETYWKMQAYLYPEGDPQDVKYQIPNAFTNELFVSMEFAKDMPNWRFASSLGTGILLWNAEHKASSSTSLPTVSFKFDRVLNLNESTNVSNLLLIKGNLNISYRLPTPVELYREHVVLPGGVYLLSGSSSLKPEQIFSAKLLSFWERKSRVSTLGITIQTFARVLKNYIFLKIDSSKTSPLPNIAPKVVTYSNIGNLLLFGSGLSISYSRKLWEMTTMIGWTWGEFFDSKVPAPYIAPLALKNNMRIIINEGTYATISINAMSSQLRVHEQFGQIPTDAFVTIDFAIHLTIKENISMLMFANNILDKFYILPTSYGAIPEPGRNFGITIKVNLQKSFVPRKDLLIGRFSVPLRCHLCERTAKQKLSHLQGVLKVKPDHLSDVVAIWMDASTVSPIKIMDVLKSNFGKDVRLINITPAK